jgi:hypothetical protein
VATSVKPVRRAKKRVRSKKAAEPGKPGRKKIQADPLSLERLAEMQCTDKEIAAVLGFSSKTFQTRMKDDPEFKEAIERGREKGKVSLRLLQRRHAEGEGGPAVNMTIHLSKHTLGQFDKPVDTHSTVDVRIDVTSSAERLAAKFDEMARRFIPAPLPEVEVIDVVPDGEFVESGASGELAIGGAESVPREADGG